VGLSEPPLSADGPRMPYTLKTPLDLNKMEFSSIFFRTHVGHRENATQLAINLIRKGVAIERAEAGNDPFEIECAEIAERWAIGHVIQGCYIEEYHQWEKAVKQYFKGQRELNGLSDDFDWKLRRTTLVRRVMEVLAFFGTTVDPAAMNAIDSVRNKVNWLKHDPLSCHVDHADYEAAQIAIKSFWDILVETESKHFA
jgi:hypothetical protein